MASPPPKVTTAKLRLQEAKCADIDPSPRDVRDVIDVTDATTRSADVFPYEVEAVPEFIKCPKCGRTCMNLEAHTRMCDGDERVCVEAVKRVPRAPAPTTTDDSFDERPATAPSLREFHDEELENAKAPTKEHVPCPTCGRRFVAERLAVHRRICAGQALPGFRAVVATLDKVEMENELVERARESARAEEREQTNAMRKRAEAAEARVAELEAALAAASTRTEEVEAELEAAKGKAERADAAAKSMEAAYDVMAEACEDGKKREELQRTRAEAAEAELEAAKGKAERADAAAKSMEAAYDVMAEACEDGKKREELQRTRAEAAEAKLAMAGKASASHNDAADDRSAPIAGDA